MDTLALSIRTRVTSELSTATRIANAETTSPPATSDRRYVVRSMALMLPSLTQRGRPPALKRRGHSHTEVPAGTWHMDITSPTVDRSQADGRRIPVVLSLEEIARLLEAAPGRPKYKAALSAAYGAGLRVSEVVALKVSDIDSERMLLRIEQG